VYNYGSLPFGKHRGAPWDEIPCDYLAWLRGQQWLPESVRPDVERACRDCAWRWPFGRYKGRPLSDAPDDYLCWVWRTLTLRHGAFRDALAAEMDRRGID
jgi:uncharacterized protein (DUF3820 family)